MSGMRDYPICANCGHGPGEHTTTACSRGHSTAAMAMNVPRCDCRGWRRDEGWPPPPTNAVEVRR